MPKVFDTVWLSQHCQSDIELSAWELHSIEFITHLLLELLNDMSAIDTQNTRLC